MILTFLAEVKASLTASLSRTMSATEADDHVRKAIEKLENIQFLIEGKKP